ncbi:3-oxoacyl-ACP synthase III family protein [Streptomyces lavendulae]|uniref:3-oxoacyl-ACP synthase III family protein n=1 Tax=Streptomyces lavendulae TaxID=1914 RepID=UPI00371F2669
MSTSTLSRRSRLEALGAHVPETVMTTRQLAEGISAIRDTDLQRITGVAERRVYHRDPGVAESSFSMALSAARDCLGVSRYEAADIGVVISASITRFTAGGRFSFEPSFAAMLARGIGARSAVHFDVSNACAGLMTGVYLLDRMIRSGAVRTGLVVSGEQATTVAETAAREIGDSYDPQFAALSVGDSAVAVLLDASTDEADRIHYVELMTCSEYSHLCMGMPSDRSQGMALYTDNKKMHNRDRLKLWPRFHGDFLAKQGRHFTDEAFDYVIQHQVGTRFIDYVNQIAETEFGAPMPVSLATVEKYGNTATTSHFLTLRDHLRAGTARPGSRFLLVPAASGVVTGALSTTITNMGV